MLIFKGHSAFSPFRYQHQLSLFQQFLDPAIDSFQADFCYFVDLTNNLSSVGFNRLQEILPFAQLANETDFAEFGGFWVVPRFGTLSPWSSKATDILKNCNLPNIRRIERGIFFQFLGGAKTVSPQFLIQLQKCCFDPLTESVVCDFLDLNQLFALHEPRPLTLIPLKEEGWKALEQANQSLGLALEKNELLYLQKVYQDLNRNPTDVELMMFAQINSEHCRHKIFNASWKIQHEEKNYSLFSMIRNTHLKNPGGVLVAYEDNAAVLQGSKVKRFFVNPESYCYEINPEDVGIVLKVETHNHPTAISPFPGAATGSGGEIRDEAATGRGAYPKAGLCGFAVSDLRIPNFLMPWENEIPKPSFMASPLEIMLKGPIGAASFNNEFGRPNLAGFFRTFSFMDRTNPQEQFGYHKPIMIAGGIGNIRLHHIEKKELPPGTQLIVLGGPAMAIGLGGGAASSKTSGDNTADLDFASVQRSNPEMQRRCQEVINSCWALGNQNPILSIHDVGAGGLSNAMPELVAACGRGAELWLREIPNAEPGMTPLEIWCNEAQERFVLAVAKEHLNQFHRISERERCPYAILGTVTDSPQLVLKDDHFNNDSVNLAMPILFEKMPKKHCEDQTKKRNLQPLVLDSISIEDAINRILSLPCVSSKSFLITIGDRSVTGMVTRDQMIGPWQVPVADVAVTAADFSGYQGEAMAMGERAPVALLNAAASARLAVGEAVTNLAAASIASISNIALSANWMAAANQSGEGANLYAAVEAIGLELCPALGIAIPVGKDSLSMQTRWVDEGKLNEVTAPLSLIITAAARVEDIRRTLTPELEKNVEETVLLLIDLGQKKNRLGGSAFSQIYQQLGDQPADLDDAALLKHFFGAIQRLNQEKLILAYHDRSDGGLLVTLSEMMFASHCGISLFLDSNDKNDQLSELFNEELGAVIQVNQQALPAVLTILKDFNLSELTSKIGSLNNEDSLIIYAKNIKLYQASRIQLQRTWSATSFHLQSLRDNPDCAKEEYDGLLDAKDPGLNVKLTFELLPDLAETPAQHLTSAIHLDKRPKVAILREQGVNGYLEMAAAFDRAGFCCVDVHMSDLMAKRISLKEFNGLAAGGGFSFGDVLGAGRGWAQSILQHETIREEFHDFFHRKDTFTLGACNGCQMLAHLKELIPGAELWPKFTTNRSAQFESRFSLVKIEDSPSIFFRSMIGSILPIAVAHGEGFASFSSTNQQEEAQAKQLISLRYVNHYHQMTDIYPFNPNGSPNGITGVCTQNGRVMIVMPHPERVFRTVQNSWHPANWQENSPWLQMFVNAREWLKS